MKAYDKLDEAKYFLEQMKINVTDKQVFLYNLSAFLSSSRSITWVLQKEYSENPKFKKWYEEKKKEMEKDKLLRFFIEKRNYVIKESPIEPKGMTFIRVVEQMTVEESITVSQKMPNGSQKVLFQTPKSEEKAKPKQPEAKIEFRWFFDEYPDKDIITLCENYYKKLEDILKEAKSTI